MPSVRVGRKACVERREIPYPLPHGAERGQRGVVPLVERVVGLVAESLEFVRVGEHDSRCRERFVFAGLRRDAIDLRQLESEELRARGFLALAREQAFAFGADALPFREGLRRRAADVAEPGELVEQVEVRGGIEQDLMFVLSVQVDEPAAGVAQRGARRQCAVDQRAAASLGRDFAPHDQLAPVLGFEDCLDGGQLFAGAHEIGGGASADQQSNGPHENALAGTGLPRQDREAGLEFQLEPVDDREVLDAEETQHRVGLG